MAELIQVGISDIDPNPHRDLNKYPYVEHKIETLMHSMKGVGMWEGVIGRKVGKRFQLAFGHHRIEAARRLGFKTAPLVVRDLTDEEMVQFMGRENLEDFNAEFLIMLETWEAATKFRAPREKKAEAVDIARLLGWTALDATGYDKMNHTARACNGALQLIIGGHMRQADFEGLSVKAAAELAERVISRIEMLDRLGAKGGRPAREIEADKRHVAGAARSVARDYRAGTIAKSNIRTEIDYRAVKTATEKQKQSPLFAAFAREVADGIHKMLVDDRVAEKLAEMEKALPLVTLEEDRLALRRIDFALAEHEQTTGKWRDRLTPKGEKVVPFKLLKSVKE